MEAKYAASAASATGLPFWVAVTIEDSRAAVLRSGEPLQDAVHSIADLPGLAAVLINCSAPQVHTLRTSDVVDPCVFCVKILVEIAASITPCVLM